MKAACQHANGNANTGIHNVLVPHRSVTRAWLRLNMLWSMCSQQPVCVGKLQQQEVLIPDCTDETCQSECEGCQVHT